MPHPSASAGSTKALVPPAPSVQPVLPMPSHQESASSAAPSPTATPTATPTAAGHAPATVPLALERSLAPVSPSDQGNLAAGSDPSVLPGPVLIADRGNNRLLIVDPQGRVRWQWPQPGDLKPGQTFRVPDDAFFTPDGTHIIATQEDDFAITEIDIATRSIVWRYGTPGVHGSGPGLLWNPDDAMMLANGNVVAADIKNCRLVQLRPGAAAPIWQAGHPGACRHVPPTEYGSPNGAFPLANGHFLVTEINGDWVNEVDLAGHVYWSAHPPGVAYPSDTSEYKPGQYMTVDYSYRGQVVIFDATGHALWRWNPASGNGRLNHPSLAEALPNGDILLNDDRNHRVIVIDPTTNTIVWQYGHTGVPGSAAGYLNNPDGLDPTPPSSYANSGGHAGSMSDPTSDDSASAAVAVTGATGNLGGRVARRLAADGVRQRLLVRDPSRAPVLPGAAVARIEYADAAAVRTALAGVPLVLMVSASEAPDRVAQHRTFVDAAVAAGVRHLVYTSFYGASPDATFTLVREHWQTEQYIRSSGLAFTFVRDGMYADFLPLMVGADGVIRGPAGAGRLAPVTQDDVADAITAILRSSDAHVGKTYTLTGPEALTFTEIAELIGTATGRRVTYYDEPVEEAYASRAVYGAPDWQVDAWVSTYTAIAAGELANVSDDVAILTGHPATPLRDMLAAQSAGEGVTPA